MIRAAQLQADRKLGVEIPGLLALRLEQDELQPPSESRLGDVHQQIRDLGGVRQLPHQAAEGLLHLLHLLLVGRQVDGLFLLAQIILAQLDLTLARIFVFILHTLNKDEVAGCKNCDADGNNTGNLDRQRRGGRVVDIDVFQVIQRHVPASSGFCCLATRLTLSENSLRRSPPCSRTLMTSSSGSANQLEAERLRMSAETRALDCALPCSDTLLPALLRFLRYTPSGSRRASSSNMCTMAVRSPWS